MLILGGFLVAAAALLAGASGFGFGIVATPALLLAGFSLPFVVTVNLLIALATRVAVAWRLRHTINHRRVVFLVAGAVPGLWVGSWALEAIDEHTLTIAVGIVVALAAVALAWSGARPAGRHDRPASAVAGFFGGVLGTTTSLIGVPPALLLTRSRPVAASLFADLSGYFVATSAIALVVLAAEGQFSTSGARAFVWWLPGALVANALGVTLGLRLPAPQIRRLTLGVAFAAGVVTAATA
jgi:uncharacterized protein